MTVIEAKLHRYLIMTVDADGNHFPYYEVAQTAREAAGIVRNYIDDRTDIEAVYREVRTF